MDLPPPVRTALKGLGVLALVLLAVVVLLGILVATGVIQQPTVEGIEKEWGTVTNQTTEIRTEAIVQNPNGFGLPGILAIEYTAKLNDVVLADESKGGVGLAPGRNEVTLSTKFNNNKIAAWWAAHVNDGERSTLTIDPSASVFGLARDLPTRNTTITTNLLDSLQTDEERTLGVGDRAFLVVENQQASWGHATMETTPLTVTASVRNVHNYSVGLSGVEYVVRMNNVTLGSGTTSDGFDLEPGESGTLNVTAALDTRKFADWWPTHVRNNQTSRLSVQMYGIVERNGTRKRVPLTLYQKRLRFETNILSSGGTTVEPIPGSEGASVSVPTIEDTTSRWGAVTDATTEIRTDVRVSGMDGLSAIRDLARVTVDRQLRINDVPVMDATSTLDRLPRSGEFTLVSEMDNTKVPEWWARHLNNGEESTVRSTSNALVDVGFTKVPMTTPDHEKTFTTDLLAGLNSEEDQPVTVDGETVLVAESTTASWGEATPDRAPVTVRTVMTNERRVPVEITSIDYDVTLNGITLANGTAEESYTIDPGETRTVPLSIVLDNSKMDRWWVTHVENGERSSFAVDATATVSFAGRTETVPLDMLTEESTIETDLLEDL